jgi:hypothetical protein
MKLHIKAPHAIKKNILANGNMVYGLLYQMFNFGKLTLNAHHGIVLTN